MGNTKVNTSNRVKTNISKILIYFLLAIIGILCLLPFYLMIINATRSGVEISTSYSFLPGVNIKENWNVLFGYFNLFRGMLNSILVAVPATVLSVYFSALCAYGLATYKFAGNKFIFITIIIFMMIPGQLSLIGFYSLVTNLNMVDSYWPLILPGIAAPGTVFFLRQYIVASYPRELSESARMDGASELYSFHQIALPLISPATSTMLIMGFIGNWNNFLTPMIVLNSPKKFTLPVMMSTLNAATNLQQNQGAIYLAVAISVIPILIVFAFFSNRIIGGITTGAVKG